MTSRDFCYWLQGFFELGHPSGALNADQTNAIKAHLALVFKHEIDPSAGCAKHQAELDAIHNPPGPAPSMPPFHDPNIKFRC